MKDVNSQSKESLEFPNDSLDCEFVFDRTYWLYISRNMTGGVPGTRSHSRRAWNAAFCRT